MSEALPSSLPIGRILCFEHGRNREPSSVVGNVFRMVTEFALSSGSGKFRLLRLPLLSTGNQGADKSRMLEAIIRQAIGSQVEHAKRRAVGEKAGQGGSGVLRELITAQIQNL
jgi:hypothetical protein